MSELAAILHILLCPPIIIMLGRRIICMPPTGEPGKRAWLVLSATYAVTGVIWSCEVIARGLIAQLG